MRATVRGCLCGATLSVLLAQGCEVDPAADAELSTRRGALDGCGGTAVIPAPDIPAPPDTPLPTVTGQVRVENKCSFPLYIHTEGGGGGLNPPDFTLMPNAVQQSPRGDWPTGWVEAYADAGRNNLLERVEMTLVRGTDWYKLEYKNGIALPIEVVALGAGPECNRRTGCYVPQAKIMSDCPDGLLVGQKCLAPGIYCGDPANQAKPVCHALDGQIARCAANPECAAAKGLTSKQAYNCDKFFGSSYKWCAAINRGMLDAPDSSDASGFYKRGAFNTYAAWVHSFCHTWAFPYDDYGGSAADDTTHTCRQARGVSVTFCPNG